MSTRIRRPLSALALLALAGCASTSAPTSVPVSSTASRSLAASAPAAAGSAEPGPSEAVKMICGAEANGHIATLAGISGSVPTTSTWTDNLYTCAYSLPTATLVLSVKVSSDPAIARQNFNQLSVQLQPSKALQGLASLGLPGFTTSAGQVVFLKDSNILTIDASQLPATIGVQGETRSDLAYTVATDILACWSGD